MVFCETIILLGLLELGSPWLLIHGLTLSLNWFILHIYIYLNMCNFLLTITMMCNAMKITFTLNWFIGHTSIYLNQCNFLLNFIMTCKATKHSHIIDQLTLKTIKCLKVLAWLGSGFILLDKRKLVFLIQIFQILFSLCSWERSIHEKLKTFVVFKKTNGGVKPLIGLEPTN